MTRRDLLSAIPPSIGAALSGTAQGRSATSSPRRLRAGAATSNITPPLGISLDGPISQNGPARHVHDELHARCLALDDGSTQMAIVICDSTMIWQDVMDEAKKLASEATGVPTEHMLMAATHTHSTPRLGVTDGKLERWYREFLPRRMADSVTRAINNLAPAHIAWGAVRQPEFLFNRRWFMTEGSISPNPFGEKGDRVRMNPPRSSPDLVRPAGPVDPELFVVSLRHDDGRALALLANYGLHYVGGARRGDISADYFGMFADHVSELVASEHPDVPFVAMMSNGTSGDVNAIDFRRKPERSPPYARMREIAHDLADAAVRISKEASYRSQVSLTTAQSRLELEVRRPERRRLSWAHEIWSQAAGAESLTRPQVYARETLALADYPATLSVPMQAFRIGGLGVAAIPCEVFAETGLAIKQQGALEPTFTIELANGYFGYLPTAQQHEWGGYETWPARSSCLEQEAETKIRAEALRLLSMLSRPEE